MDIGGRCRLRRTGIANPDSPIFAPVDFEEQGLGDGLRKAGFALDKPTFFSCLGVVIYLTLPAVMEALGFVASRPGGSEVVFDYSPPLRSMTVSQRAGHERIAQWTASIGEPLITYFDPAALAEDLHRLGFRQAVDLGPEEANRRYFRDRADGLGLTGAGRIMRARV